MGLDTPTPTGSSSASNSSQHSQPPSGFDPFGGDGPNEPKKEEGQGGGDDSFLEDLNGLDGIGPLANLTNTPGIDPKVEPFFTFTTTTTSSSSHHHHHNHHHHQNVQTPASANGLYSHGHQTHQSTFSGPGSAPAGPCSADSGHSSSGVIFGNDLRRPSSSQTRLVIRDPFAPDLPPFAQSPNGQEQQPLQPMLPPLNWDGKPPPDAKSMAEMARAVTDPGRPPMVPLPNVKEGGGVSMMHGGMFPQWSFLNLTTPMQRQRLEQLYPPGTFSPNYWGRWSQMPMPMLRPMMSMAPRIFLMPMRPGMQIPPGFIPPALVGRIPPGHIPAMIVPGPNGQLVPMPLGLLPNGIPPGFAGPIPPPGIQPPTVQQMTPTTTTSGSGGSGGKSGGSGGQAKPKKETVKQRKQREKEEQQRREQQEQEQAQTQVAAIAAGAAMSMGRSPMDAQLQPPPFYGTPNQMRGSMAGGQTQQQQQQDACFKVPGRSPPLKRCNSSRSSAPLSLTPMPEQRIHAQGQCSHCQMEINQNHKAIQCTAISQGCNLLFHWDCAGLSTDAFTQFCQDSRLEWICQNCFHTRSKEQCLMFAC